MSDVLLLSITSVGLGLYALLLLAKQKLMARSMQVVLGAIYEGYATIEKINGRYVPVPNLETLQCKE
jgi:hypothetical protein